MEIGFMTKEKRARRAKKVMGRLKNKQARNSGKKEVHRQLHQHTTAAA